MINQLSTVDEVLEPIGTMNESSSIDDVVNWAKQFVGLEHALKLKTQEVDGKGLINLNAVSLERCGIPVGPASTLANEIQKLKEPRELTVSDPHFFGFLEENREQFKEYKKRKMETPPQGATRKKIKKDEEKPIPATKAQQETPRSPHSDSEESSMSEHTNDEVVIDGKTLFVIF